MSLWRHSSVVLAASMLLGACSGGGSGGPVSGTIDAPNNPPVAFNINMQTAPSTVLIIRPLDSSVDRDGDQVKLVYVTQPSHGIVTIEDNGTPDNPFDDYLRFVCDDTFVGTVSFQYAISDGRDGRASGRIEITVGSGTNNPPIAVADAAAVVMNGSVSIDVMANDSDPDGDSLTIVSFSSPGAGNVVLDDNGTGVDPSDDRLIYAPLPDYTGLDSFTYQLSDGDLVVDALVTVEVGSTGPAEQVCGRVMKGPVQGALVHLLPIDDLGNATTAVPIAQALTDSTGLWCADIPLPRTPLLVRSIGGQFIDETDTSSSGAARRTINLDNSAFLETVLGPTDNFVSLNVYTNAVYEKARRTAATAGSFFGIFSIDRSLYRTAFGWSDDLQNIDPANPAALDPSASEAQRIYAMALGGIANVVNGVAVSFAESEMTFAMIRAVVIDLTDCILDGHYFVGAVRTPVEFNLNGSPVLMPDNLRLNLSILRFRNNNLSAFGATPLAQIDATVCLGPDDNDDSLAPSFVPDPLATLDIAATGPLTNLLTVVPTPVATDNFDPVVDVQATAIATDTGVPVPLGAPDVPPGSYDITWDAIDDAGNFTQRMQRINITRNHDGAISLSPDSIIPGDTFVVSVSDGDLNTDPAAPDFATATVINTVTFESEALTLIETAANTGVFTTTLATAFGTGAGADDDGILIVQNNDNAEARYDDALDADGLPVTVADISMVDGGTSGTIAVMPASILPGDTLTVTVTDTDLDTTGAADTFNVTVENTAIVGETASITLTETGATTGIFQGTVNTVYGTVVGDTSDNILNVS
ncbi:MAG: cadherin-like domain-containing protein, partial [Gammaproteobacteria bacterium]|nr:cadherin-like domain-containing protein [Gammaproteobacteria bacterium]